MLARWHERRRARRDAAAAARRPIADDLWKRTRVRYPFLRRPPPDDAELRRLTSLFLDRKEFHATGGLVLSDAMAVAIAAQACLPVLRLGLDRYDGFVGIVVHPGEVVAARQSVDDDGVVHAWAEVLAGEAMPGGPVMLSWADVRAAGRDEAAPYNVVIHEFAHVLDMADGVADGVPWLPPAVSRAHWCALMAAEHEALLTAVDAGRPPWLDPYAVEGPEEFFAVASEAFFVGAAALRADRPLLYDMLARFYAQDPAAVGCTAGSVSR